MDSVHPNLWGTVEVETRIRWKMAQGQLGLNNCSVPRRVWGITVNLAGTGSHTEWPPLAAGDATVICPYFFVPIARRTRHM